jgi:hypothetical protein
MSNIGELRLSFTALFEAASITDSGERSKADNFANRFTNLEERGVLSYGENSVMVGGMLKNQMKPGLTRP